MVRSVPSVALSAELGLLGVASFEGVDSPTSVDLRTLIATELSAKRIPAVTFDPLRRVGSTLPPALELLGDAILFGTGADWPVESSLEGGRTSLRVPFPIAIENAVGVSLGGPQPLWPLQGDFNVDLSDTIGFYAIEAIKRLKRLERFESSNLDRVLLAVPNACTTNAMSCILRNTGTQLRLIWRPVAALIGALDSEEWPNAAPAPDAEILVLHLGIDGFEASLLHVHEGEGVRGPILMVPARPKISVRNNVYDRSLGMLRWVRDCTGGRRIASFGEFWARCWLSSINPEMRPLQPEFDLVGPWDKAVTPQDCIGPFGKFKELWNADVKELYRDHAQKFAGDVREMMRGKIPYAVVVSGAFADENHAYVENLVRDVGGDAVVFYKPKAVEVGAALFGWRETERWATYLDKLPQVELQVKENEVQVWRPIVNDGWVDAGQQFDIPVHGNFSLDAGANELKLAVALDEEEHVRISSEHFDVPEALRQVAIPLTIQVKVQAATGHPVVIARGSEGIPPVVLDWAAAESTGQTPAEYLADLPSAYPPTEPLQSAGWWARLTTWHTVDFNGREVTLRDYLRHLNTDNRLLTADTLSNVRREMIKRKWNRVEEGWSAICDDSGNPQINPEILNQFRVSIWDRLQRRINDPERDIIKILGFSAFHNPEFEKVIIQELTKQMNSERGPVPRDKRHPGPWMYAVGSAIRSSENARIAIKLLVEAIENRVLTAEITGKLTVVNDPLKQLSWLMAHRATATRDLSNNEAEAAVRSFFNCAKQLYQQGNVKIMFRWSIRCVALALRRRSFDHDFLDPGSQIARDILRFCEGVRERLGIAGAMPGVAENVRIQTRRDLKTFIEYVNRQGHGSIIVDDDEDD